MNSVLFISAYYRISKRECDLGIPERLAKMTKHIPVHLFCSPEDVPIFEKIPNLTLYPKELGSFKIYDFIQKYTHKLPDDRNPEKDTKEYMGIMNMKAECLYEIKQKITSKFYVWIDAGISKIFSDSDKSFSEFYEKIQKVELPQKIILPGCWPPCSNLQVIERRIIWRFCGGVCIVPHFLVDAFAHFTFEGCKEIAKKTGKCVWEVNVWAFIERFIPIVWKKADHNERIFDII